MINNLDIIVLSLITFTCFIVFIIASYRVLNKVDKTPVKPPEPEFGRVLLMNYLLKSFSDKKMPKKKKKAMYKAMYKNISDMESDGVYFPEYVREEIEKRKDEMFCEYSGLPSVKSYENRN